MLLPVAMRCLVWLDCFLGTRCYCLQYKCFFSMGTYIASDKALHLKSNLVTSLWHHCIIINQHTSTWILDKEIYQLVFLPILICSNWPTVAAVCPILICAYKELDDLHYQILFHKDKQLSNSRYNSETSERQHPTDIPQCLLLQDENQHLADES